MDGDKKSHKKYVSVRKALRELRVNEDQLEKIIAAGGIKAYHENNDEVKFDADELEKYRASCAGDEEEKEKIADESLYESMDGSFDSLFLSQTSKKGGHVAQKSVAEEIPKEPDLLFATANGVNKGKRENVEEYLQKKKAKPVSPVKAIYGNKSKEKSALLVQVLLILVIVITSVNSYILLQTNKVDNPEVKKVKVFVDEMSPELSFPAKIYYYNEIDIIATASGFVKEIPSVNTAIKEGSDLFIIENKDQVSIRQLEQLVSTQLLDLEIILNKLKKAPAKIEKDLEAISMLYKKDSELGNPSQMQKWLDALSKDERFSSDIVGIWLEKKLKETAYHNSVATLEMMKNLKISCPFSGKLTHLYIQKDSYVSKGDILAHFVSEKEVFAIDILDKEYQQINFSEPIMVKVDNEEQEGVIVRSIPQESGYIRLNIVLKKDSSIKKGNDVSVRLTLNKKQCVQVPNSAVYFVLDSYARQKAMICKVLTRDNEHIAFPTSVVLGISDGNYVEVISGVEDGNYVITESASPLSSFKYGQKLNTQ